MKIHEKAWKINSSNLKGDPYFFTDEVFYSNNRNQAKQKILDHIKYDGYETLDGEHVDYLNLKIQRAKWADQCLVDGEIMKRHIAEYREEELKRDNELDKLVKDNPGGLAYIMKGGYYYRPNNNGYTEFRISAGVYPIEEAAQRVKKTSLDDYRRVILIDPDEHNELLNKTIADMQTRIIQ